ncbi:UNVERIFIED_CONTAM: hypothetical protein Sradi_5249100 [Sesamum radiatum]|uniref:Reverse transcriptase Ty1/copia-type domain-containing protein n=1 Tax=Sesamum radiatum TaxID=300843 RepID=A0AAW2LLG4_SESRA
MVFLRKIFYMLPPDGSSVPAGKSPHEHCLFIKHSVDGPLILLVYVDDILIAGASDNQIVDVKRFLDEAITKDLGSANFYLGLEIARSAAGMSGCRLLYLGFIGLDIAFSAQQLSQFINQPAQAHMDAVLHLVQSFKGIPNQGLFFPSSNSFALEAFCDVDLAGYVDSK